MLEGDELKTVKLAGIELMGLELFTQYVSASDISDQEI